MSGENCEMFSNKLWWLLYGWDSPKLKLCHLSLGLHLKSKLSIKEQGASTEVVVDTNP